MPVELIVLNYKIGKQGEGPFDGQIHYIIDDDISQFGSENSDIGDLNSHDYHYK